jgi:hypothetical protein
MTRVHRFTGPGWALCGSDNQQDGDEPASHDPAEVTCPICRRLQPEQPTAATARELLARVLPQLERLGDYIGNGRIDPARAGSLGERCDLIGDIKDWLATTGAGNAR